MLRLKRSIRSPRTGESRPGLPPPAGAPPAGREPSSMAPGRRLHALVALNLKSDLKIDSRRINE
jgi:hypothetical protein